MVHASFGLGWKDVKVCDVDDGCCVKVMGHAASNVICHSRVSFFARAGPFHWQRGNKSEACLVGGNGKGVSSSVVGQERVKGARVMSFV